MVAGHQGCRGLSVEGVLQAECLSRRWLLEPPFDQHHPFGGAYSSTMRRSVETALIAISPMGISLDGSSCGLCEIHPGVTDGMSWREVADKFGDFDIFSNPESPIAPGAESWNQMRERAINFIESLILRHRGQTVLIFTHQGVIDVTLEVWLGRSQPRPASFSQNTGLTTWSVEISELGELHPVLNSFNDTSHLVLY